DLAGGRHTELLVGCATGLLDRSAAGGPWKPKNAVKRPVEICPLAFGLGASKKHVAKGSGFAGRGLRNLCDFRELWQFFELSPAEPRIPKGSQVGQRSGRVDISTEGIV